MTDQALIRHSEDVLAVHARSFRWAAPFLARQERSDAAVTYAFCREVDDLADEAPDPNVAREALSAVLDELSGKATARPLVAAYNELVRKRSIDSAAGIDLVVGVRSDCDEVLVESDPELLEYCYRVAGTVGLMMAGILGAHEPKARPHAVHLGMGMQLTNICRDVLEDAGRGRVYLPRARLEAVGVSVEEVLTRDFDIDKVFLVVRDLLTLAERFYASADVGMGYLPRRARLAIYVAARLYRAIGLAILRRGPAALRRRTVVGPLAKLFWVGRAFLSFAGLGGGARAPIFNGGEGTPWGPAGAWKPLPAAVS